MNIQALMQSDFFKYLLAAAVGYAVDLGSIYGLHECLELHYQIAVAGGFLAGLVVIYILCKLWVFAGKPAKVSPKKEFLLFALIGLVGLGINHVLITFMVESLALLVYFAKILSTVVVVLWNFAARKFLMT